MVSSELERNKEYVFTDDFTNEYYKENFTKGEYLAEVHLKLLLEDEKEADIVSSVPFKIK